MHMQHTYAYACLYVHATYTRKHTHTCFQHTHPPTHPPHRHTDTQTLSEPVDVLSATMYRPTNKSNAVFAWRVCGVCIYPRLPHNAHDTCIACHTIRTMRAVCRTRRVVLVTQYAQSGGNVGVHHARQRTHAFRLWHHIIMSSHHHGISYHTKSLLATLRKNRTCLQGPEAGHPQATAQAHMLNALRTSVQACTHARVHACTPARMHAY